jgi:UDP-N-acetyl-D-glucosamine dehydrogenase
MTSPGQPPISHFSSQPLTIGVIGLGYVGLPLLVTAASRGLTAVGYDVASERVEQLSAGSSHVDDVTDDALRQAIDAGARFSGDPANLGEADALIICVPSPLGRNRQPDLSYIEAAAGTVRDVARPNQLVSLESTTYPGTTEDYIVPAVEAAGLTIDENVWVAFSPERVSPGDSLKTGDIPKVVGGVTPDSTAVAAALYRRLVPTVHTVSSARAAEMTKLLENTYRAVNIGLVNEMAQLAETLDIDIWEVVDAAATKPFGFQPFWPGPGVGGHCIPLDPQFLAWRAREANFATRFIDLAEQVNSKMPAYNAGRIAGLLNASGRAVFGTEVLGVGIAYKPNVADDRESASLEVLQELRASGATISVLDSLVGPERIRNHGYEPVDPGDDLSRFAVAAILTDHDDVDYAAIADAVPIVYDARGVYGRLGIDRANVHAL